MAIKVESLPAFSQAHDLGLSIVGYAMGPYRIARVPGSARLSRSWSGGLTGGSSRFPARWPAKAA